MRNARHLGTISLCSAAAGFVGMELLLRNGVVSGTAWRVLADAFEAGTVGAMADWFAVTALFREVPIPFLKKHTNIVVKNRVRIIDGIADMVQNRWLSPQVIREHLAKVSPSAFMIERLDTPAKQEKVVRIVSDVLAKVAESIDGPEVSSFLERAIRDQLEAVEIHGAFGRWFETVLSRGDHHAAWDLFLSAVEKGVAGPGVDEAAGVVVEPADGLPDRRAVRGDAVGDARELRVLGVEGDGRADGEEHDPAGDGQHDRRPEAERALDHRERQHQEPREQPHGDQRDALLEAGAHQQEVHRRAQEREPGHGAGQGDEGRRRSVA